MYLVCIEFPTTTVWLAENPPNILKPKTLWRQSSRFYAQAIAQLVTGKGREALTNTVELVPSRNLLNTNSLLMVHSSEIPSPAMNRSAAQIPLQQVSLRED